MEFNLTDTQVRVIGCLIEKEMATPDYYPLSLNALVNACNQKSNRDPVVSYGEATVLDALAGLLEQNLVGKTDIGRVAKYEQLLTGKFNMITSEAAALCVMLLRGPQTAGEIRGRTDRLHRFSGLDEVAQTIAGLEEMQLVRKLPKMPGRKESRFTHLLAEMPDTSKLDVGTPVQPPSAAKADNERIEKIEAEISAIREEMENLRQMFLDFRRQFE